MKRIGIFLLRTFALLVGLIAIVWLGRNAYLGVRDLTTNADIQHQHDQQAASFPAVATQISIDNATLSYERTHAPTDTLTPTDLPDGSLPTDVPQSSGKLGAQVIAPTNTLSGPPPTNTPHPTATTGITTAAFTETPTVSPTAAPSATPSAPLTLDPTANPAATTAKLPTVAMLVPPTLRSTQVTAVPSQVPRLKSKDDIVNILLSGTDADVDPSDPTYRTDSMVIVSINRTANLVSMLSLPRDLYVFIPTLGMQRLNVAFDWGDQIHYQPGGGFGLMQQTILYNFGIPVHYYAKISFNGFKTLVDTINGIDLAVDCPVTDLRYQGAVDAHTPVPSEYTPFTLNAGYYHMNGSLALWYARMRHASSDFDRSRRQQQVLRAIWRTARSQGLIDLSKIPDLWGQLTSLIKTDMTLADVVGLAPLGLSLNPGDVRSYYMFKGYETKHWTTPAGEDVQLPDPKGFTDTLSRFYTPPTQNRLTAQGLSIDIVNSSGNTDWDKVAVDRLAWGGFTATAKGSASTAPKTIVYDYTGNANPATLSAMLKALNVNAAVVQSQPDPNRTVDFKVVLGADYNTCSAPGYTK